MEHRPSFFLAIAKHAAFLGGKVLLNYYDRELRIAKKEDHTWVTLADRKSEKVICDYLKLHTPSFSIVAEESAPEYGKREGYQWIVDPLDGTANYHHGIPLYAVSIGLEYDGEVILGAINLPAEGIMLSAIRGKGCYANTKQLNIGKRWLQNSILSFETYFDWIDVGIMHLFVGRVRETRIINSACSVLAYIALGRIDGCIDRIDKPWDWAAGSLIVSEAGGVVSNLKGRPLDLYTPSFVAANPRCHREIISILKGMKV